MTNIEFIEGYELLPKGSHVLCALSGGRDSVYLLYRLLELAENRDLTLSAAHYNHHLRDEESNRDEEFVQNLCAQLHVPLFIGGGNVAEYAQENGLGIETAARELRYAFLESVRQQIRADLIATAHHADDQAETMLLQLARGAGTKGLSGIPPRRGYIVRPMLLTTRQQIDGYLQKHEIAFVEDSSNEADVCSRNVLRHHVMPVLQSFNSEFVTHAAQTALLLREDDAYLQKQADLFLERWPVEQGVDARALRAEEFPVSARVIRTVWGSGLTRAHVHQILALCDREGLAYAHVPGCVVRLDNGRLWTDEEIMMPTPVCLCDEQGAAEFGKYRIEWKTEVFTKEIHNSFNTFCLKCENIKGVVNVTARQSGDCIKLAGTHHTKQLKKLFSERKMTQPERATVPVLRDEAGVVAIYGFGIDQRVVPEIGDRVIYIQCEKKRENGR